MSSYPAIYEVVRQIPKGKIASYGHVARAAGIYRGARLVGWALKALPNESNVPWHRVVNQKAVISIINAKFNKDLQKSLLENEGIQIKGSEGNYEIINPPWHDFL